MANYYYDPPIVHLGQGESDGPHDDGLLQPHSVCARRRCLVRAHLRFTARRRAHGRRGSRAIVAPCAGPQTSRNLNGSAKLPWRASEYQSKICPKSMSLNMDQATWNNFPELLPVQIKVRRPSTKSPPLSGTRELQISRGGHIRRARTPPDVPEQPKFCAGALNVMNVQPATSQQTAVRALSQQERRAE
jgi:hypothetical protein